MFASTTIFKHLQIMHRVTYLYTMFMLILYYLVGAQVVLSVSFCSCFDIYILLNKFYIQEKNAFSDTNNNR